MEQPRKKITIDFRHSSTKRLDILIAITYIVVCLWLLLVNEGQTSITVCPSKLLYQIPCPGCGVTRATLLLLKGHFIDAVTLNPNCLLSSLFVCLYPVVGICCLLFKHSYIADCYEFLNRVLSNKYILGLFLICEGIVWVHNVIMHI